MEFIGEHRVIYSNRQWRVTSRGDTHGRRQAGLGHWLILRGEAAEPRWLGKLAKREPAIDRLLLAKALQVALAQPDED